ncbi:AAA domain-containing protein [Cohnella sp. CFH 77786]|uniref:AAA family ATPase n=1 Tax=Cohnella sp. CFH 77786 TaxID=2662265 RepID=UPI001C60AAD6|nr:AAA family ATPase [Cohnella sp. CFH 77786]MBW5448061.1 AAA domain-containing protein [Cohnella sp. CFH 77786]
MIETKAQIEEAVSQFETLRREVETVIVGQREVVEQLLWCVIAGGHALLEGIPGLGKTMLVRTVADALDLRFSRIQFTPDLMPSDITGTQLVEFGSQGQTSYRFQAGPIFGNLVLADEINRATPKTQSALLEAMQERTVTAGGETHKLPSPFFVLATQNPVEQEGTYPLPEAQLDRFLLKIQVTYPTHEELREIVRRTTSSAPNQAGQVADAAMLMKLQAYAKEVLVSDEVLDWAIRVLMLTHPSEPDAPEAVRRYIRFGAGPRGIQAIIAVAKVKALLAGNLHVSRRDIREVALPALRHRLVLGYEGQASGIRTDDVIAAVLEAAEAAR